MTHFPLLENLKPYDIVLASQSPRRTQLLKQTGIPFRVESKATVESFPSTMSPDRVAEFLCRQKAMNFADRLSPEVLLITADTIVVKGCKIYNKAANPSEAFVMLNELSATTHQVITGVCLRSDNHMISFQDITTVFFKALTQNEIQYYIDHYKPFDKAGAYGIQEWIGLMGVQKIEGCFYNVMGLPVPALYRHLAAFPHAPS